MSCIKTIPVVGVTFVATYPNNLITLARIVATFKTAPIELRHNPANPHDANAVEVHCPIMPDGLEMLGHVGRDHAARLAPLMDAGVTFGAWVSAVRVAAAHTDRPGLDIAIERRQPAEVF